MARLNEGLREIRQMTFRSAAAAIQRFSDEANPTLHGRGRVRVALLKVNLPKYWLHARLIEDLLHRGPKLIEG